MPCLRITQTQKERNLFACLMLLILKKNVCATFRYLLKSIHALLTCWAQFQNPELSLRKNSNLCSLLQAQHVVPDFCFLKKEICIIFLDSETRSKFFLCLVLDIPSLEFTGQDFLSCILKVPCEDIRPLTIMDDFHSRCNKGTFLTQTFPLGMANIRHFRDVVQLSPRLLQLIHISEIWKLDWESKLLIACFLT